MDCRLLVTTGMNNAAIDRDAATAAGVLVAALDVFDTEPLPADHPLLGLDNVVLTPHLGYVTRDNLAVFYRQTVENIAAYLRGAPIRVLNPEAVPAAPGRPGPAG